MQLPIVNKQRAQGQAFAIITFLIFILFFLYSIANGLNLTYLTIVLVSITIILTLRYLNKHNLKEAILFDDLIVVKHGRDKIEINIEEIEEINVEINGYSDKLFEQSVTYTLDLKTNYSFGSKIYLRFEFSKENLDKGPLIINIIRSIIKHKKTVRL